MCPAAGEGNKSSTNVAGETDINYHMTKCPEAVLSLTRWCFFNITPTHEAGAANIIPDMSNVPAS
jgi:hypothetical protein